MKKQYEDEIAFQKKIHRIELDALRSQLNPHFIHNSLNAIQYYIQRNEVEISENYLTKFSKLMRMFFEYSKKASITIRDEVTLLKTYLEIEKLRFEDKIEYTIEVDDELNQDSREVPTMLIQPIVENAINGNYIDYPVAEQASMAIGSIIKGMSDLGAIEKKKIKNINIQLEKVYVTVDNSDKFEPNVFITSLKNFKKFIN